MKKIISIALCAALLISMAAVSYSADSPTPPPTLSQAAQGTAKKPAKKGEALYPVTLPAVPAVDDEAYYKYVQEHQTPEAFIRSMQKFGAKTAPMVLTEEKTRRIPPSVTPTLWECWEAAQRGTPPKKSLPLWRLPI